jgi:hypothetical protein
MHDPLASALARRLAHVLGLSALALPALAPAGCGGKVVLDTTAGSSSGTGGTAGTAGTAGTGGATGTGGTGGAEPACLPETSCFPGGKAPKTPPPPGNDASACFTPANGEACPDAADAASSLQIGCAQITSVVAPCAGGPAGMCCYNITYECTCVGRPFLVDGAPRTAAAIAGDDRGWRGDDLRAVPDLPREAREALAALFTREALGEHASIASFARFTLELMAAGAPADLVADAHRAALDEVRHAQIAFGLASALGGAPVGPGPMPCATPAIRTDLASFAAGVAAEGCVHETIAALVAAARARAATVPAVAEALATIAEDEARHAELAWRTLAWALAAGGDEAATAVSASLAGAVREALAAPCAPPSSIDLRAFGVLDAGTTAAIVASGVAGVVEPCARALLCHAGSVRHTGGAPLGFQPPLPV